MAGFTNIVLHTLCKLGCCTPGDRDAIWDIDSRCYHHTHHLMANWLCLTTYSRCSCPTMLFEWRKPGIEIPDYNMKPIQLISLLKIQMVSWTMASF